MNVSLRVIPQVDIDAPDGFRIDEMTLSPTGDQLAVLFETTVPNATLSGVFSDAYSLQVFDASTGALVETMADPGVINSVLDIY